jgi:hypothetical protein
MYGLNEIHEGEGENKRLVGVDIIAGNSRAAMLRGGLSLMVTTAHAATNTFQEGQAFLHGIVLALNHCAMTGKIPTVVDGD